MSTEPDALLADGSNPSPKVRSELHALSAVATQALYHSLLYATTMQTLMKFARQHASSIASGGLQGSIARAEKFQDAVYKLKELLGDAADQTPTIEGPSV